MGVGDGRNLSCHNFCCSKGVIMFVLTQVQIRTRNYNRNSPPADPTDWDEPRFGWIFILFMINWVLSVSTATHHSD